jgi:hypothetical protein
MVSTVTVRKGSTHLPVCLVDGRNFFCLGGGSFCTEVVAGILISDRVGSGVSSAGSADAAGLTGSGFSEAPSLSEMGPTTDTTVGLGPVVGVGLVRFEAGETGAGGGVSASGLGIGT